MVALLRSSGTTPTVVLLAIGSGGVRSSRAVLFIPPHSFLTPGGTFRIAPTPSDWPLNPTFTHTPRPPQGSPTTTGLTGGVARGGTWVWGSGGGDHRQGCFGNFPGRRARQFGRDGLAADGIMNFLLLLYVLLLLCVAREDGLEGGAEDEFGAGRGARGTRGARREVGRGEQCTTASTFGGLFSLQYYEYRVQYCSHNGCMQLTITP